jgi:hypothetical protein
MAIDFPTSPSLNQTLTSGSTTWRWNGTSWVVVAQTITASGLGLGNVENTAVSTWAGSSNITTLGTVGTGTWSATNIALNKGGTNASLTAVNGGVAYSSSSAIALTAAGASGQILTSSGAGAPTWTYYGGAGAIDIPGGRLTLTSGNPVPSSDVTSATTLYYTPFLSNRIDLYSGSIWVPFLFSEISLSVPANTLTSQRPKDVFIYSNSGVPTLELGPNWTSDTARSTAIVLQNGIYVKSGDTTRRYLGTIRGKAVGLDFYMEDSLVSRFVWNFYNQVPRALYANDSTGSWTDNSTLIHQSNNTTLNQVEIVVGLTGYSPSVTCTTLMSSTQVGTANIGIGVNTVSNYSAYTQPDISVANRRGNGTVTFCQPAGLGYSYYAWLYNVAAGAGTWTWYGGTARSGLSGAWSC